MSLKIYRAWINQPSLWQPLHDLHGQKCIVKDTDGKTVQIFFTEGDVHSMEVSPNCVSRIYLSDKGG